MATATKDKPASKPVNGETTLAPASNQILATMPQSITTGIARIEQIAKTYGVSVIAKAGQFERAIILAQGVKALRAAFTQEIMAEIMCLQGSRLGFKTDKDREGGYPEEVVKNVMIEMILRGFMPVGNEINIIAGNGYGTKEGYERVFGELEGVTDVRHFPGVPAARNGGVLVDYKIECKHFGEARRFERKGETAIPIRVNSGMGADAILGKARRKILKFAYDELTQSVMTGPDGDLDDAPRTIDAVTPQNALAAKLAEKAASIVGATDSQDDPANPDNPPDALFQNPGKQ